MDDIKNTMFNNKNIKTILVPFFKEMKEHRR